MAFTREVVFLKWGASKFCFYAKVEGYQGGIKEKPAAYSRSLYDGSLQRVYAPSTVRRFVATFLADDERPDAAHHDGAEYIHVGSVSDLLAAWEAKDLQVLSFEDSAYWDAEWDSAMVPQVAYDPRRRKADVLVSLVQR